MTVAAWDDGNLPRGLGVGCLLGVLLWAGVVVLAVWLMHG